MLLIRFDSVEARPPARPTSVQTTSRLHVKNIPSTSSRVDVYMDDDFYNDDPMELAALDQALHAAGKENTRASDAAVAAKREPQLSHNPGPGETTPSKGSDAATNR